MKEFRARLRPPLRTLWLGCEVSGVEHKMSRSTGRGYLHTRFSNCPFFAIWHATNQKGFRQALYEKGRLWPENAVPIVVGDKLNLDVKWELAPEISLSRPEMLYPRPWIELDSVVRKYV